MDADAILIQAKSSEEPPHGWIIFPLSRGKVITGIIGWIFGILIGLGLFAIISYVVIPYNYERGPVAAIFTTFFLGIFLFIGLGSIWSLITDVRRLREAATHIIVLTPQDFVKQEGQKIIHVPLMYVRHVTVRGRSRSADRSSSRDQGYREIPTATDNLGGLLFGRNIMPSNLSRRRKRRRTPTSLAFIDSRTDSEVMVVTDEAYGDPYMIAAFLKQYARSVQQIV
jgi:hypothetical protein